MAVEIAEQRGLPAERHRTRLYEQLVIEEYGRMTGGKEMIQIGDWVRVQPHTKFVSLSGGAVIDPPKEVRHNGYQRVRVVQVLNDGPGTETVVVEVGGQVDYIPLAYVEKTCTD